MKNQAAISIEQLLSKLPENSYGFRGDLTQTIRMITWDYRKVVPDTLYFCLEDEEFQESHIATCSLDYWQKALKSGAVCLMAARNRLTSVPAMVNLIEVDQLNPAMAMIARTFYGDPMSAMKVIGITGTNGKTTTSQMLDSVFQQMGKKTGVIGTIGVFYPSGKQEAGHLSNPMATELFAIGDRMQQEGVEYLTMEVTSHAMAFDRNDAIDYDVGVFTNLTQDHLDYHRTMASYKKAKTKFFRQLGMHEKKAYGIVNIDDATGQEFIDAIDKHARSSGKAEVLTYGIRNKDAELVAYPKAMTGAFSEFDVFLRGNHLSQVHLPMPGLFNIYNALAAFGASMALGISIAEIVDGLANARKVDGRFEKVDCPADFDVFVDYAHTPDSLSKILQEIRGLTRGRVVVVFGCGGDRDRTKRPEMGRIAAEIADLCIVTSDNPRSEDPQKIIADIVDGMPTQSAADLIVEPDRKQAIWLALKTAATDDAVLIAGKGHETYQIIGQTVYPFFDRKVVEEYFKDRGMRDDRAWLEIDLKVIDGNFQLIDRDRPAGVRLIAVVKDDALGHGIVETSRIAMNNGCEYLGVACLSEAMAIRKEMKEAPILIFGERADEEIAICLQHGFALQIQSFSKAERIARLAAERRIKVPLHLKVDTGLGRYGIHWESAVDVFRRVHTLPGVLLEGIMTHFARSDEKDKAFADLQWQRFQTVLSALEDEGLTPKWVHACNSGGYLDLPQAHGNMVRIGTLPLGVYPSKVCRRINIDGRQLKPAMSAKTRVAFLKTLQPGDSTGYGMHFKAAAATTIAVLPIGYGDGYPRLRNTGHVLIRGHAAPIVGGNGLDATMVDVTAIDEVQIGDEVVLLGRQKDQEITAMMIADWAGTVTYDILVRWTRRMGRVYR
jgi:alanine racemase